MTQAFNLAQLANNLNTSGQLDATDGLYGVIPVANGGTGQSSLTANNVVLGNGTSGVAFVAPSTSGNVLTSNGTTWVSSTPGGFGVGQTWQNVTGSRSSGTTYTNSTGKPIAVSIIFGWPSRNNNNIYVDGIKMWWWGIENNWAYEGGGMVIVPNGSTYYASANAGFSQWNELR